MNNNELLNQWIIETVKEKYKDDIALVISHSSLQINDNIPHASYFVPINEKGYQFGRTFILDGTGYDIWGIDWDRMEKFASLDEYNITCLADGEIMYARTNEDAKRFEDLKRQQAENLRNPIYLRKNALEAYSEAKRIFSEMLFANISDVRMSAGYIIDYLAQAIAFTNGKYFKKAQTEQVEELNKMEHVPDKFTELYLQIIRESNVEKQKKLCCELVTIAKNFLDKGDLKEERKVEKNYQDLADWYGELSYTWLRIYHYCDVKNPVKVYMWGIYLQKELNHVCKDFGLEKCELMEIFAVDNLVILRKCAEELEKQIRQSIVSNGGKIHEYRDIQEFLNEV